MQQRAFTPKEVLLALVVLAATAAVLIPLAMSMQKKTLADADVEHMRRVYMGTAMYDQDWEGFVPATLDLTRPYLPDEIYLQSTRDPFTANGPKYPMDAGLPNWKVEAKSRISFTYIYAHAAAKKLEVKSWYELKYDVKAGFIADEWQGTVQKGENFDAKVGGKLLRLNTDGALRTLERAGLRAIGNGKELFFDQP